ENIGVLNDDIALVNTDAKLDPFCLPDIRVALSYFALHLGRAAQRVHHAAELDQKAIARCFYEPAAMLGDLWIDHLSTDRPKPIEGALFVGPDEARIPGDIGC